MNFTLLSAIPCSRVDLMPCCKDGRGGWVYSQCDPCRCCTHLSDPCRLYFALSVFAAPSDSDDRVEFTTLTAKMGTREVGSSTLDWNHGHWGVHLDDGAIYSWPQNVQINAGTDGLVDVEIKVKLHSQTEAIAVSQFAHCHIRQEDRDAMQQSRLAYLFSRMRRNVKTFR